MSSFQQKGYVRRSANNKKCAPKLIFFNEKKWEIIGWFLTYKIDFESQILALFDTSPLTQYSKFYNFLWVCWFLGKNLSSFVPPVDNSTTRIAIMFRPCGQSLFEVSRIVKMRNQRDFQPIVKLIFPPNTMFLQGNETTKSSISLSFCLAMASPFALNYHNGVKKFMKSHWNFYPLAISKRQEAVHKRCWIFFGCF